MTKRFLTSEVSDDLLVGPWVISRRDGFIYIDINHPMYPMRKQKPIPARRRVKPCNCSKNGKTSRRV